MNIKVVDIRPGKDIQHVVIRSIQSGKENKDMLLWKDEYLSDKDFEFVLGESYFGSESINISGTPHILIGGASGSGKSKLLKSILMQAKKKEAIVILADMKGGVDYPTIWHKKWKTSSTNKLKYLEIRSINSADGVLSPRSILPTVLVLYLIAAARSSW